MIWDVLIIITYILLAFSDLAVMTRRGLSASARGRRLRVMACIGLPGAVLLHSITAWIFGVQISRPGWNSALLAPVFVTSAILSGTALVTLVALAAKRFGRFQLPQETWSTLTRVIATTIAVDLFLVAADYITILWGNVPRERATLDLVLPGGSWQWVFWLEWIAGGLIPFVLLVVPRWRRRPGVIGLACALVLVGVYAFRVELIEGGLLKPLLALPPGVSLGSTGSAGSFQFLGSYHPTWVEYAIVAALLSFLTLLIVLGYRWLRSLKPAEAGG